MNRVRRLSDLASPQIGAVSGGRQPYIDEEAYIEGEAEMLPALAEAEYRRRAVEEETLLAAEDREQAARDSRSSLAITGAGVGLKAAELGMRYAGKTAATEGGKAVATTGARSVLASGSKFLGPAGVGFTAGTVGGERLNREIGKLGGVVKGKTAQKTIGGAAKGAAAGAAYGSVVPGIGTGIGALVGGISGAVGGNCVIVTACEGRDSFAVKVARQYRNQYLDARTLRGYYRIADVLVPVMKRFEVVKWMVRRAIVAPVVRYGEGVLAYKAPASWLSRLITKTFLSLCWTMGSAPSYQRLNGEVI